MEASLRKENNKLQEELSTASKELQDASNDEDEVMVSQPRERVQNMKKDRRKKKLIWTYLVYFTGM